MTPSDHVGDDPVPHAGGGSQGLSVARLTGLLNGTYAPITGSAIYVQARRTKRGIEAPATAGIGLTLLRPKIDTVMASPPTVGATATTSTITSVKVMSSVANQTTGALTSHFRYYGSPVVWKGTGFPSRQYVKAAAQLYTLAGPYYVADFWTDATVFEFIYQGASGGNYRVRVDGELVTVADSSGSATSGLLMEPYTFGSRKLRHIEIEMSNGISFGGINIGPTDTLFPASDPIGPKVFRQGDSFVEGGSGRTSKGQSYGHRSGRAMGWRNVHNVAVGGTGLIANGGGSGGKDTIINRMASDVYPYLTGEDVICLDNLGFNDSGSSSAAITAAATALFTNIATNAPTATLIAHGPCPITGVPGTMSTARDAVYASVLTAANVALWIDPIAGTWRRADGVTGGNGVPWFSGTGKVGATVGDGSADIARASDGTHPTDDGDRIISTRWEVDVRSAWPLG